MTGDNTKECRLSEPPANDNPRESQPLSSADSYCLRLGQILQQASPYDSFRFALTKGEKEAMDQFFKGKPPTTSGRMGALRHFLKTRPDKLRAFLQSIRRGKAQNSEAQPIEELQQFLTRKPPATVSRLDVLRRFVTTRSDNLRAFLQSFGRRKARHGEAQPTMAQSSPGIPPSPEDLKRLLLQSPRLQAIAATHTSYTPSVWLLEQELRARGCGPGLCERAGCGSATGAHPCLVSVTDIYEVARETDTSGLCLSGGGIRSATFNLGILQGLASLRLLCQFNYLSSVSGGGYIHQFFAAWLKNHQKANVSQTRDFVQNQLAPLPQSKASDSLTEQPEPIRWLRRYSNYLTPRTGLFSPDTWVMVAVWTRNTFLNQLVLVATLAALLCIPHLFTPTDLSLRWLRPPYIEWRYIIPAYLILLLSSSVTGLVIKLVRRSRAEPPHENTASGWKIVAWLLLAISILASPAVYRSVFTCPPPSQAKTSGASAQSLGDGSAILDVWWMSVSILAAQGVADVAAGDRVVVVNVSGQNSNTTRKPENSIYSNLQLVCPAAKCTRSPATFSGSLSSDPANCPYCANHGHSSQALKMWFSKYSYPVWLPFHGPGNAVATAFLILLVFYSVATAHASLAKEYWPPTLETWIAIVISGIIAALAGCVALHLTRVGLFVLYFFVPPNMYEPLAVVILPFVLVSIIFLAIVLSAGVMGKRTDDALREDMARLRALSALLTTAWLIVNGFSLLGPYILQGILATSYVKHILSIGWLGTTVASVLAGKSPKTSSVGGKNGTSTTATGNSTFVLNLLIVIGPPVFIAGLLLLIASALQWAITSFCMKHACTQPSFLCTFVLLIGLVIVLGLFGTQVDINDFSMHAFYRDRIARCYAGATFPHRRPDRFTGFARSDSAIQVVDLLPEAFHADEVAGRCTGSRSDYAGPFPIFCSTVNLTFGQDLAWQERKGASFAFTPLYSGYSVGFTAEYRLRGNLSYTYNGFVPTCSYAYPNRGIHMHSAVAISGAAISPNWGYHTNPAMAFLLTMFNVRLGWWLKNPRLADESACKIPPSPRLPILSLLSELAGRADDTHPYVYLTDGGHFDNMGLYELVRRRCRRILICDAEEDARNTFEGIGMAIRKARVDFGAEISLDLRKLDPRILDPSVVPPANVAPIHFVEGTIRYPEDSWNTVGTIVYVKASITGNEPGDVLNYKREHDEFPHESTTDQWFTESQFESYRRLGYHIVLGDEPKSKALRDVLDRLFA